MRSAGAERLNAVVDVSRDFTDLGNTYFHAGALRAFDAGSATGTLCWERRGRKPRMAFNQVVTPYEPIESWEFPPEYGKDVETPFALSWITPRTVRLRLGTRSGPLPERTSLMLDGPLASGDAGWTVSETGEGVRYRSEHGSVTVRRDPWQVVFRDAQDRLLTGTVHANDCAGLLNYLPTPFSFVRRSSDMARRSAASFSLAPNEKLYGGGESFTRLNKRGQKLPLWTCDAHGVQSGSMYKPVPFFLSSQGYGMFVHTSAPVTLDFGHDCDSTTTLFLGDEEIDLFFFIGSPKEILAEYTALTGRSPMPPRWSFGLWMSRITYKSEAETREVADMLREHRIPCDVIHLDTGWFETDWRCDYQFAPSRFSDAPGMIADLRKQGLRISLWQLPYFTPRNPLYAEALAKGFVVRSASGNLPTEDAIVDFSNADAVAWYQALLAGLLRAGVGAIKADFGEGAPLHGLYASGTTGFYEHNLYPLRYNLAVAAVTRETTGENIIWARSAWAGSQRCPIHWGGDAENTDSGMAASLRGGLSLGLCGFSFWSHDIGGFVKKSPEELYRRWMPFGMLTSHSRCHGVPPKEPWAYGAAFMDDFRRAVELKYRLMPYILAQSEICCANGWPLLRTLFFEYPEDPGSWLIEDAYLLGSDLLVAPLFEEAREREVYLPPGTWIDYQTRRSYPGESWQRIEAGEIPCVILVRGGAVIPHYPVVQSTDEMEGLAVEPVAF